MMIFFITTLRNEKKKKKKSKEREREREAQQPNNNIRIIVKFPKSEIENQIEDNN